MELFKLLGTIAIDNADANKALKETSQEGAKTESKLKKVFSGMGKAAAVAGKTIATGLAVGAAAMTGLTVKALQAAGDLEQNMGGAEAVFGELGETISDMQTPMQTFNAATGEIETSMVSLEQVSKQAFQNMGLSQSDYLATANKMGALFKGAGFETQEALDLSSQAMQRAADVASIMGIDTEAAMEAVAGAAKGNFTMMDNLGVAMNDTAIEAYALSKGIDKSTSEMTQQEKIGLAMEMFLDKTSYAAGNYAKENATLAGSLGTAKAAMSNFLAGSGDVESLVTSFSNLANVVVKSLSEIAPRLTQGITDLVQQVMPLIPPLLNQLLPVIVEGAVSLVDGLITAFPQVISALQSCLPTLMSGVSRLFSSLVKALPEILQIFINMVVQIGTTLAQELPTLIPVVLYGILDLIDVIINNIPLVLDAITSIITGIIDALPLLLQILADRLPELLNDLLYGVVPEVIALLTEQLPVIIETLVNLLMTFIPTLVDAVMRIIRSIAEALPQMIQSIVALLPSIINKLVQALITLLPVLIEGVIQIINGLVSALPQIIQAIVDALPSIIDMLVQALITLLPVLIEGFIQIINMLVTALPQIIQALIDALPTILQTIITAIITLLPVIIEGLLQLITALTAAIPEILPPLIAAIPQIIAIIIGALLENLPAIIMGLIQVVMGIVTALPEILGNLIAAIPAAFQGVWDGLGQVFGNIGKWFGDKFGGAKDAAIKAWSNAKEKFNGVKDKVVSAFNNLKDKAKEKFEAAKEKAQEAWSNAKEKFNTIKDNVASAFDNFKDKIKEKFENAKTNAQNAWSTAQSTFSGIKDKVVGAFSTLGSNIKEKFKTAYTNAKNAWSTAKTGFNGIKDKVVSAFSNLGSKMKEKFKTAYNKAKEAFNNAKDIGKEMVTGIWNGIGDKLQWIKDKISGWVGSVLDFAKKLLGIASPSKVFRDEVGRYIAEGVAVGIIDNTDKVENASEEMSKKVLDAAKKRLENYQVYNELTLADEVGFWDSVRLQVAEGTDARIEADKNYYEAKKSLDEKMLTAEENLQTALSETTQKVDERAKAIQESMELFAEFEPNEALSVDEMFGNLDSQINAMTAYQDRMAVLEEKIGGTALFEELKEMGVSALNQVGQLSYLSDKDLNAYLEKYNQKAELARSIATNELGKETTAETEKAFKEYADSMAEIGVEVVEQTETMKIKAVSKFKEMLAEFKAACESFNLNVKLNGADITTDTTKPPFVYADGTAVEWFDKAMNTPLLMNSPTIFGYNSANGKFMAGGESGSEVVSGTETLLTMIKGAVAEQNSGLVYYMQKIIDVLAAQFPQLIEAFNVSLKIDGRELATVMAVPMDEALGKLSSRKDRGR